MLGARSYVVDDDDHYWRSAMVQSREVNDARSSATEAALQSALGQLFDLTRPAAHAGESERSTYVRTSLKELVGKSEPAWQKKLEQVRAAVEVELKEQDALLTELRARLERQFWASCPARNVDDVQSYFRGRQELACLHTQLCHAAREFVAKQAATIAGDCKATSDLRRAVAELFEHKHVKAGEPCPDCDAPMVDKARSRDNGKFVGCSRYPECTYAWGVELGHRRSSSTPKKTEKRSSVAAPMQVQKEEKSDMASTKSDGQAVKGEPSTGMAGFLLEMTKEDLGDAVWRTTADEVVETCKIPAKTALRKLQRTSLGKPVASFTLKAIDHPLGEGVFSLACGLGIVTYGPLMGRALGPKTMRLSKELRVKGLKPFTDLFARTIIAPVRGTITKLVESLPDQASA
jgi:ssDNA-binding Zn-finger/Zn-ribbon topoisomerase 1